MKSVKILNHGHRPLQLAIYGLGAWAFCCPLLALATVANISIVNFAFTPSSVSIGVNDSVKWTWAGSPHSTTSDTGLWESGVQGTGATFTHVFTSAGSFPFHCSVHPFMTGTIAVQSADVPPTVIISNPTNGSVLAAPATLDLAAGNYTFSAVAADNAGTKVTNSVMMRVVSPEPTTLTAAQRLSPSSFQFSYSATVGLSYVVQRSVDLSHWTVLSTNSAKSASEVFLDQNASGNAGSYRVGLLPNP